MFANRILSNAALHLVLYNLASLLTGTTKPSLGVIWHIHTSSVHPYFTRITGNHCFPIIISCSTWTIHYPVLWPTCMKPGRVQVVSISSYMHVNPSRLGRSSHNRLKLHFPGQVHQLSRLDSWNGTFGMLLLSVWYPCCCDSESRAHDVKRSKALCHF